MRHLDAHVNQSDTSIKTKIPVIRPANLAVRNYAGQTGSGKTVRGFPHPNHRITIIASCGGLSSDLQAVLGSFSQRFFNRPARI
jgi:hypothetical protein